MRCIIGVLVGLKNLSDMDWIQGDEFIKLGKYTFAPQKRRNDDYDKLPNTLDVRKLRDGDIIYTHTIYVKELFEVIKDIPQEVIVVSHNGDVNIDFPPPDNVIMWYTQNVNILHDRVEPIPIGLENDRWFKDIHKKEKMLAKLKEPRKYKNLVYMNFNIATNPAKREEVYKALKDKEWVTVDMGSNGHRFDEYLDNIYNHKFVLCPEGNGIDTHRVWETLYMGSIPVVENNISAELLYSYFPCLITHNGWTGLDDISLRWEFNDFNRIKKSTDIHNKMLTFEYWKNKILSHE